LLLPFLDISIQADQVLSLSLEQSEHLEGETITQSAQTIVFTQWDGRSLVGERV
jgi:hypothetical protein